MPSPTNIHDAFFKQIMSQPETAGQFLRERLPVGVTALLSEDRPELLPGSFVDEELASHHTDLLFRARLAGGGDVLLHVLVEHKSSPDPLVPLQVLRYMVRIWDSWLKQGNPRPLPLVVPFVVYHGARAWNIPAGFGALFGDIPEALRPYLPAFDHALADLGRIEDEALSRNLRLRAFLKALKYILRSDLPERMDVVLAEAPHLDMVDVLLVLTYIDRGPVEIGDEVLRNALRRLVPAREEEIMGSFGQRYFEEGKAQGVAQGVAQGMAEVLTRQLSRRFGNLPDDVRQRISSADVETLDRWSDLVIDAPSLDAVFARAPNH